MPKKTKKIDLGTRQDSTNALKMARRALAHLEERAAGYTSLTIPTSLKIELEDKRREVAELEARSEPVKYQVFVAPCDDTKDEQAIVHKIIELCNRDFLKLGKCELGISSKKEDADILIGILWRSIVCPSLFSVVNNESINCGKHDQRTEYASSARKRRDNSRPAILLYMKTDPKPMDYCYQDAAEQAEELFKQLGTARGHFVIPARIKIRQTINDVEQRFEYLLLTHLFNLVNTFLQEDR